VAKPSRSAPASPLPIRIPTRVHNDSLAVTLTGLDRSRERSAEHCSASCVPIPLAPIYQCQRTHARRPAADGGQIIPAAKLGPGACNLTRLHLPVKPFLQFFVPAQKTGLANRWRNLDK